MDLNILINS